MNINIKSQSDIQKMRKAGEIVAKVLAVMESMAKPGMTTKEMDATAECIIRESGATPSFKNYNGFPAATCMSVDDVVVHGFPSERPLKEGEILSVDVGAFLNGFHCDAARTFAIGNISPTKQLLIDVTKQSFFEGIKFARAGNHLGDISQAIEQYALRYGFSVVRTMTGHGIGRRLHEDPSVPNYGRAGTGVVLKSGFALAIEPMLNQGKHDVYIDKLDGWTCRTVDGLPSAHYENTIIITDGQPEILTLYEL